MEREDLIRNVLQAAGEFNGRRLWKRFTNFDCFAVRIPDRDELMLGVVLGDAGEQYGLSLFRGPGAVAGLAALLDPDGPGDDSPEAIDVLGFSMEAFGDLPPEAQALFRGVGIYLRHGEQVPSLMAKPPGRQPRLPDDSELALLLLVLRGAVEADKCKLLQPARLDDKEGVCVLALAGDPLTPQVSAARERLQIGEVPKTAPLLTGSPDLAGLPFLDATWLVGTPVVPAGIEGDDRTLLMLLVVDDADGFPLQGRPVFAGEPQEAMRAILDTFRGKGVSGRKGLPRKIVFSSQNLHDAMKPFLEQAGVKCIYMPKTPKLLEIAAEFLGSIGSDIPPFADYMDAPAAQEVQVPAPDDLAGWKASDRQLARRFSEYLDSDDRLWSSRAVKRYFGDDDLEYFLTEHRERSVAMAYSAWGILDYRPTRASKTHAEKMLAEGLPEPEATLLRARMEACPTLYRVAGHDPEAGTVDLDDVLLGGTVTVYDQLMSENIENGLFVAGRAFPAGRFHFLELAGPPLGAGMGMEAVEFLRGCGMEFTREGLRRDCHMFGWLWDWIEEWEANWKPPRLANTDGDDLLWHTASFSVASPADVRRALVQRPDIEHDETGDEFIWTKQTGRGAEMLGGPVTLGRIEFVGDELVLTVNSFKRFAAAREWIEKLPGVAFRGVKTRRMDEPKADRPMDERIAKPESAEITPDMAAGIQEMLNKQYMAWLDRPLPVFGGKSPRQVCRTPEGREQVTMLIRTMPDPMGPAPVRVPRQAMLRDLGLAAEPLAAPPLVPPRKPHSESFEAVPSRRKVGRNEPCPCGSGKKYKICCGR
jgi:hypothetical protein